jgi:hypothetical protein
MALKGLFRKKTVQDILKQVEKNNTDGHNALGKHLTARDLTAFGIAAIVGAGIFSTIGKQVQMVVLLFSYFYLLQSHAVLQLLLMLNLPRWFLFQCLYVFVCCFWRNYSLDYRLGINHGILCRKYHCCYIVSDYFTGLLESGGLSLPQWVQMDFCLHLGFDDATALMQSGKEYVNLSPALQDAYTAWTTSPVIGSFHFVADLPALLIIVLITALIYRDERVCNASNIMVVSNCVSFF